MGLFNSIKLKLREMFGEADILEANKINNKGHDTIVMSDVDNDVKVKHEIIQEKIFEPEKQLLEINTNIKKKAISAQAVEFRDNNVLKYNIDSYGYKFDNSRCSKYSIRIAEEPSLNNAFYELNRIERGCLNLFEQSEVDYFEELEKHENLYGDVIKFGYRSSEEIGLEGEKNVHRELTKLNQNSYKVIHNVLIKSSNGKTSQIDTIIISTCGIFVVETKNYRGTIVGSEDSEKWACYYDRISHLTKKLNTKRILRKDFFNPVKQNKSHIASLKVLLERFNDIPYYSIIVFNEEAQLMVETLTHVIHISNLIDYLSKYKVRVINELTVKEIYNEISDNNIVKVKAIEEHKEYANNIKNIKERTFHKINIDLNYIVTLYLTPGIGIRTIEYIQENLDHEILSIDDLMKILFRIKMINPNIIIPSKIELKCYYEKALNLIKYNKQQGISLIPFNSNDYPKELKKNSEYPIILFLLGDLACLKEPKKVGILGSNKAIEYANKCAERFGEVCADNNIVVVSFIDEGCNLSVVKGSLAKTGKVMLVVPNKLKLDDSNVYSKLYYEILNNGGCVISCMKSDGFLRDYRKSQFNGLFVGLCMKFIGIDVHSSSKTLEILKLGFQYNHKIAYLDQSKKLEQKEIDKDAKLMAPFGAKPLKDKHDLQDFLYS